MSSGTPEPRSAAREIPARPVTPEPGREPAKPDPSRPDPSRPHPSKPDPSKPDPSKPDPPRPKPPSPSQSRWVNLREEGLSDKIPFGWSNDLALLSVDSFWTGCPYDTAWLITYSDNIADNIRVILTDNNVLYIIRGDKMRPSVDPANGPEYVTSNPPEEIYMVWNKISGDLWELVGIQGLEDLLAKLGENTLLGMETKVAQRIPLPEKED